MGKIKKKPKTIGRKHANPVTTTGGKKRSRGLPATENAWVNAFVKQQGPGTKHYKRRTTSGSTAKKNKKK